jgi:hypothetical protein
MLKGRAALCAVAFLVPVGISAQQSRVIGTCTSSAPIVIDDIEMQPTAAAAFPVVDGDEIAATSAPALFTTSDKNLVTFERESKARVGTIEGGQTYVYVRQGGVSFVANNADLDICMANSLFIPAAGSKGILRLEKTGAVSRVMSAGALIDDGQRACDDHTPGPLANQPPIQAGGNAGGTATAPPGPAGGTATAPTPAPSTRLSSILGGVGAGSAAAGGLVGAFANTCTSPGGCNHNPLAVSPSTP